VSDPETSSGSAANGGLDRTEISSAMNVPTGVSEISSSHGSRANMSVIFVIAKQLLRTTPTSSLNCSAFAACAKGAQINDPADVPAMMRG